MADIRETANNIEKVNKARSQFFEKSNKMDK